jgi:cellulose synthase/poly-beta-1,6-N-acetylglucosamine synthase-like glycosyltransferase
MDLISSFAAAVNAAYAQISNAGALFIPIGTLGIIRWCFWLAKVIPSLFYRPIRNSFDCSATVITPVYNEDPRLFRLAIDSWIKNKPERIIAVVDVTDTKCQEIAREYREVDLIVTDVPGKRDALVKGIRASTTDIVALVDSDVIWEPDVLNKLKMPFEDPKMGGVGTRQFMVPTDGKRATVWERLADVLLDLRYTAEVPATVALGSAVSCLSGRTAAYRTDLLKRLSDRFLGDTFRGRQVLSGEDKWFTSLVLESGYKTYNQLNARVYSTFKPDFKGFVKQRVRWGRNSLRSDLRALWRGWVWRYPYLALTLLDKTVAPFTLLLSPIALIFAVILQKWWLVGAIVVWWLISRAIKLLPHFVRKPADIILLPLYVPLSFFMSLVRAHSLITINRHEWLTRNVAMQGNKAVRAAGGTSGK